MSSPQVADILARLELKTREMEAAAVEGLVEFAHHAAQKASDLAPIEAERHRADHPAGALRDSLLGGEHGVAEDGVRLVTSPHGPEVIIGSRLPYATTIEYDDQPYLRPALHASEQELHKHLAIKLIPVVGS